MQVKDPNIRPPINLSSFKISQRTTSPPHPSTPAAQCPFPTEEYIQEERHQGLGLIFAMLRACLDKPQEILLFSSINVCSTTPHP